MVCSPIPLALTAALPPGAQYTITVTHEQSPQTYRQAEESERKGSGEMVHVSMVEQWNPALLPSPQDLHLLPQVVKSPSLQFSSDVHT